MLFCVECWLFVMIILLGYFSVIMVVLCGSCVLLFVSGVLLLMFVGSNFGVWWCRKLVKEDRFIVGVLESELMDR